LAAVNIVSASGAGKQLALQSFATRDNMPREFITATQSAAVPHCQHEAVAQHPISPERHSSQQGSTVDDGIHVTLQGLLEQQLPHRSGYL